MKDNSVKVTKLGRQISWNIVHDVDDNAPHFNLKASLFDFNVEDQGGVDYWEKKKKKNEKEER